MHGFPPHRHPRVFPPELSNFKKLEYDDEGKSFWKIIRYLFYLAIAIGIFT